MDSIVFSLPFPSLNHLSETFPGSIFFLENMITFLNLEEGEGYEWKYGNLLKTLANLPSVLWVLWGVVTWSSRASAAAELRMKHSP